MQFANCTLALGGDLNNIVPKWNISAAEISILQAIHGNDAILEVELVGEAPRDNRPELERLRGIYGHAMGREGKPVIDEVYPGRGAQVVQRLADLELAPEQYKDVPDAADAPKRSRKQAKAEPQAAVTPEDLTVLE